MVSPDPAPARTSRTTRHLTVEDFEQSLKLGGEAFGVMPAGATPPTPAGSVAPGRHTWGTFEGDRLLARVVGREFHSWFGGARVATCGVAGVTVVAEHRGDGLLAPLLRELLVEAAGSGEVVSTLFPTAPGIYRGLGYEVVGAKDTVEIRTADLERVRRPERTTVRRATTADFDAVRHVYDTWAAAQNGPLTRSGPSFAADAEEFVDSFTGVTLAEEDGKVVGFASWDRGQGYDATSTIEVSDLLGLTADATRALWRVLGSFGAVTGHVHLETSGDDVARLVLPTAGWRLVESRSYMLRVLDVAGAFTARAFGIDADVTFAVAGDPLGMLDGDYRLVTAPAGGPTRCERVDAPDGVPTFTPQGLALAYAGAQGCGSLRLAGHLTGPDHHDATLDALLGGRRVHIRDYF
ncbi:GNAT family N-acetyltransferase [Nocardioides sp. KIGAM211]|uniref:GNAT family N-acetyltransferase n=1 Tax=Nocardioides luti TaxID=2761101 RepID=A0A7X0RKA0_9ACTN|nr:GNAT family N-acetyltransferase [Nocardioides luti]MBB6628598.1 GNAT family N-acetyltransferase [Nocardioides luti]